MIAANLDAVAVAVHAELAAAGDTACLNHGLEMRHVFHVFVHIGSKHLQRNDTCRAIFIYSLYRVAQ